MPNNVKITTMLRPLDLLAPHSCRGCGRIGAPLCDCCKNYIIQKRYSFCPNCKTTKTTYKCPHCKTLPPVFATNDRNGVLDHLIHEFKYSSVRALASPLAEIMASTIPKTNQKIIIVPLPTINRHIRSRGLDHTKLIAKRLAKLHPTWQAQSLLLRQNHTVQVGSDQKTRINQAKKAYKINPHYKIDPTATYLLIDDVWTTGASIKAANQKLRQSGVKETIVSVLAVSQFKD